MCISVVILTLNEEVNLPGCLESLSWCDDVVVFDSLSTDGTEAIARAAGARFIQRAFDDYAAHRNAALESVPYRHPWVWMVDADERVPGELAEEARRAVADAPDDVALYSMRRKDMFMGRWLRRSTGYPTWFGRLIRLGRVRFDRPINEVTVADGRCGYLREHLVHYPFSKGVYHWLDRHNRYSTMEAAALIEETRRPMRFGELLSRVPSVRRKALKQLAYRLPYRPFLVFCYLFLVRRGFLDGRPGVTYCAMRSVYEYMIDLKARELRRRAKGLAL
jgi:glycosyltransferase involved in cell wall biosynthesis